MSTPCPCGSGRTLEECCGVYHAGREPETAEALMRSRYSAFVLGLDDYIIRTLHPEHEDLAMPRSELRASLAKTRKRARYRALEVIDRDGPDANGVHRVLFHVTMMFAGKDNSFAELSTFLHDGTGLRYRAGLPVAGSAMKTPRSIKAFEELIRASR